MRWTLTRHVPPTLALSMAAWLLGGLLLAPAARAVTISAPSNVLGTADVRVRLAATETAGLGMLTVDGAVVRTAELRPSVATTFGGVPLAAGTRRVGVIVRSRAGFARSRVLSVRSWDVPAAPRCAPPGAPGLLPRTVSVPIRVGSETTKLTTLVNGVAASAVTVTRPGTVTVTLTLAQGTNTIVARAENPVARTSTTFRLTRPVWPLPGYGNVSSGFGMRWGRLHKGIDIPAPEGTRVVAAGAGTVIWARPLSSYGGLVMIDHGGGMTTYYAHLSRITATEGRKVTAGQAVGAVGVAGTAHLHFQLFTGARNDGDSNPYDEVNSGTPVDPYPWVAP